MSLAQRLREEAETLARSMQKDLVEATLEKQNIEYGEGRLLDRSRLGPLEREIQFSLSASERLADYKPELHTRMLDCPYCWIVEAKRIKLIPVPGPVEAVACSNCASEYSLES